MEAKQHPVHDSLWVSEAGIVTRGPYTLRQFVSDYGYAKVAYSVKGKACSLYVHKLVWEAFHGEYNWRTHNVDHIDTNKQNNNLSNLQLLTRSEHALKTHADNPDARHKSGMSRGRAVVCSTSKAPSETDRVFPSQSEAARVMGVGQGNISKCVLGKINTLGGYFWRYADPEPDLPDEAWRTLPEFPGHRFSSEGRVAKPSGITTRGAEWGGYMSLKIQRRTIKVHTLICMAFYGPQPSPAHTVDHINRIRLDNHASNLRWATWPEQKANQTRWL